VLSPYQDENNRDRNHDELDNRHHEQLLFTIMLMLASISFMTTSVSAMPSNLTLANGCPSTQPIDQAGW
jgi:hypothetical protein